MKPTITIEQANQKVEDYLTQIRAALPAEAQYKLTYAEERGPCLDPTDNGSTDRMVANRSYQVLDLPKENIPAYFDAVRAWSQSHNFRILDNNPPNEYLWLENNADAFRMAFKASPQGNLFLTASSPCVWPDGTPIPEAQAVESSPPDTTAQAAPAAARPVPQPVQKPPKPRRPPVDDEDFAQTDWTDDDTY
jgi:hypothetical protein